MTFEQSFWEKIDKRGPDECWPWLACCYPNGYGQVSKNRKSALAHRVVYELTHFVILDPKTKIRNTCDNPPCCNPSHLLAGTQQDNMDDMVRRGRATKSRGISIGSKNGKAKLTEEQVLIIRQDQRILRLIAADYGVHLSTIAYVKNGRNWKLP
jgi:hypothetical protein